MSYLLFSGFGLGMMYCGYKAGRDVEREAQNRLRNSFAATIRRRHAEILNRELLGHGKERR